jgi:uncharacterized protein (TIGR02391 family)
MNLATRINSELWNSVRRNYETQAWTNAIQDAIYHFSDVLRAKSGLQSDGTALAGQALGGKDPKIKINRLTTESEKNIQAGIEQLVRGLYQAVRNPRSHERFEDSQKDCESVIVFVDFLLDQVGHAKSSFSIEATLARINDENFVANKRYAELILSEVPRAKRLDLLIAAFEQRHLGDCSRVKQFFQACLAELDDTEKMQFFSVVSSHLRGSNVDSELRTVFQLLEKDQWLLISEADRMRSENRVIRSIRSGRYDAANDKCLAGGLATWARKYFSNFTLKREAFNAIYDGLTSESRAQQDYMFQYMFLHLDDFSRAPPTYFVKYVRDKLARGDQRYKDALEPLVEFDDDAWATAFKADLEAFQPSDEALPSAFVDDEIPF